MSVYFTESSERPYLRTAPVVEYKPLSRVKPAILRDFLKDHPNRDLVNFVIDGFTHGFKLGLTKYPPPGQPCENSRAVKWHKLQTLKLVNEEIAKGHILGPFDEQPFPSMVFSPLNVVPKNGDWNDLRLIHNLAFPYDGWSVNDCIPIENAEVKYSSINDVIAMAVEIGVHAYAARIDISSAFRNLPMALSELPYLGFTLCGKFYINSSLPFGASSSCQLFEKVACLLEWIVKHHTGCSYISHFLDDFPLLHVSRWRLRKLMDSFIHIVETIGFPIAHKKTLGPASLIDYLGLSLNFHQQLIGIPENKRNKCLKLILQLRRARRNRSHVKVKLIQKVCGSLNFICQALPAGKPFLMDLYKLTRGVGKLGHNRHVSASIDRDMQIFQEFLMESSHVSVKTVPFLCRLNVHSSSIELYSNAAGAAHLGWGCFFGDEWAAGLWSSTSLFYPLQHFRIGKDWITLPGSFIPPNIAILELLAAAIGLFIWSPKLAGTQIVLRTDSAAAVGWLNSMKSDIPACTYILKELSKRCLHFQIAIKAIHVKSVNNTRSDLASRRRFTTCSESHHSASFFNSRRLLNCGLPQLSY